MTRADEPVLSRLARHFGTTAPEPLPHDGRPIALDVPDRLVERDDPALLRLLEERLAGRPDAADVRATLADRLRAFVGLGGRVRVAPDRQSALRGIAGDREIVELGDDAPLTAAALDTATAGREHLLIVVEPRFEDVDEATRCRARLSVLRSEGARLVADETRTAGRTARRTAWQALGADVDAVLLGPSLAAGLPLFVTVESEDSGADELDALDPIVAVAALAVVERLVDDPLDGALAELGEGLRSAFRAACRRDDVHGTCSGPPQLLRLRFEGQENAESPLIAHHFGLELRTLGVRAGPDLSLGARHLGSDRELAAALDGAVSRIRTLLIEHNSWLSGGVPFVFQGGDERLRARGIARYRYPKLGAVDVEPTPDGAAMRIAFAPGELGPITSSGFYLPTRVRGDFDVRLRFRVVTWEPGPDSACLGLFVQNELSTARYYAQLMSTGDRPGERSIAAGMSGELLGRRVENGHTGWLRLTREGPRVTAWHRTDDSAEWTELGVREPASTDDVIVGAKIWSKVRCGGLVCELSDLSVDADVPDDQFPELEARPDPRPAQGR